MTDPDRPLLGDMSQDIAQLRAELGEMLSLRWQLARLEFDAALAAVKRLLLLLTASAVMLITALPLVVIVAAELLDGVWAIPKTAWLIGFCSLLAVSGGVIGWRAWRRFRNSHAAFEETLEELHEDVVWLRELTESRPTARQADEPRDEKTQARSASE